MVLLANTRARTLRTSSSNEDSPRHCSESLAIWLFIDFKQKVRKSLASDEQGEVADLFRVVARS